MGQPGARDRDAAPERVQRSGVRHGHPEPPGGLLRLQRAAGNAAVTQHLQRYAVGVPATADHAALMAWITTSNPYAPDSAAKTNAAFTYKVAWVATGSPGAWTVTPKASSSVALSKDVDMPQWRAKDARLQTSWAAGVAALRAHEKAHEDLAVTWRATLEGRLKAFSASSTADTQAGAGTDASTALAAEWVTWLDEHQAAQDALDPYQVVVADPYAPAAAPVAPSADSATGGDDG